MPYSQIDSTENSLLLGGFKISLKVTKSSLFVGTIANLWPPLMFKGMKGLKFAQGL